MSAKFSDAEIARMIAERKTIAGQLPLARATRDKRGHKERELDLTAPRGTQYRLILRQSDFNAMDFSIILTLNPAGFEIKLFRPGAIM